MSLQEYYRREAIHSIAHKIMTQDFKAEADDEILELVTVKIMGFITELDRLLQDPDTDREDKKDIVVHNFMDTIITQDILIRLLHKEMRTMEEALRGK